MPSDPDRRRRVRVAAKKLREQPLGTFDIDDALGAALRAAQSVEEIIGLLCADARSQGQDEVELCETLLRAMHPPASVEELESWGRLLEQLAYHPVSVMMRRLKRSAPSRPPVSVFAKAKARQAARLAGSNRVCATKPAEKLVQ